MSDGLRLWMLRRLGGVDAAEAERERRDLGDAAEDARTWRRMAENKLRKHEGAIASHLRSGAPIACPECGSTELFELSRGPAKVQVRCVPNDHRSLWTVEGLPLVPFQEMVARVQREQVEPLQARLRAVLAERKGSD